MSPKGLRTLHPNLDNSSTFFIDGSLEKNNVNRSTNRIFIRAALSAQGFLRKMAAQVDSQEVGGRRQLLCVHSHTHKRPFYGQVSQIHLIVLRFYTFIFVSIGRIQRFYQYKITSRAANWTSLSMLTKILKSLISIILSLVNANSCKTFSQNESQKE